MKRIKYICLAVLCVVMAGCRTETVDLNQEVLNEEFREDNTLENVEMVINTEDITEVPEVADIPDITESEVVQTQYISIDLSTAKETYAEGNPVTPLNLEVVSKEDNGIDWAYEWYENKKLSLPMIGDDWDFFYDETYEYLWKLDQLSVFEKETGNCIYILDYPSDKWYVNGNNAYLKDGIFYGASVFNGYAQADTCFLFASDLINDKLLWRSADQSCNTMNFVVKGDIILCGYGFTSEKDYLYQINRTTGEIIDRLELASKPDLLVEQDGKLYVHTYNCNYVIEME